jgi:toxin ParE1/3/4
LNLWLAWVKKIGLIESTPLLYPVVAHDIRRAVMGQFPYNIYYVVNQGLIDILAVWHGSRNQEKWLLSRLI